MILVKGILSRVPAQDDGGASYLRSFALGERG